MFNQEQEQEQEYLPTKIEASVATQFIWFKYFISYSFYSNFIFLSMLLNLAFKKKNAKK